MRVLVTGASGHIAALLIRLLSKEGFAVRALVRSSSNTSAISHMAVDVLTGDIQDKIGIRQAMEGCEAVFHLAAPTREVPGIVNTIIRGTENVLTVAAECGVSTVVYTSSIVTIGYSFGPEIVLDESSHVESFASQYHSAKYKAEQLALTWARKGAFRLVIVNPSTVVGAADYRVTPSNEVIDRAMKRDLRFTFDSGLTIAPVQDVARGHLLALLHGRSGERYILGGERLTIDKYFQLVQECCGRLGRLYHLPRPVLLGIGAGFSLWRGISHQQVPFTYTQAANLVGKYGFYSSGKAEHELGYKWRSAKDAILDYVHWVRAGRPV